MALVDHGAAWLDLVELIESRDGWGSKSLLAEMAKLEAKHRVSESFLQRALRIYGGRVTLVATSQLAGSETSGGEGTPPDPSASDPAHSKTEEVANGRSREPEPVG